MHKYRTGLLKGLVRNALDALRVGCLHPRCLGPQILGRAGVLLVMGITVMTGVTTPLWGIQPSQWVHTTEADFAGGTTEDTVVSNLGDVKLATLTEVVGEIPEQASVIYDLQLTADGSLYLAVGPEAALLKRRGEHIEEVLRLPKSQVFSLDLSKDGRLLVGVSSGEGSKVGVLEGNGLRTLVELDHVRYIWDMIVDGDRLILATGTKGRLLSVDLSVPLPESPDPPEPQKASDSPVPPDSPDSPEPEEAPEDPRITELLDASQSNLLCLARDPYGRICVGTDTDGLVYRVTLRGDGQPEAFVLYDATEPEIGTLLVMNDGTIYAGTADAEQARPGRLEESTVESGRPELMDKGNDPGEPDQIPQIPPKPDPKSKDAPKSKKATPTDTPHQNTSSDPTPGSTPPGINPTPSGPQHAGFGSSRSDGDATVQRAGDAVDGDLGEAQDRLRELIRRRLRESVDDGKWRKAARNASRSSQRGGKGSKTSRAARAATKSQRESKEGNAIYRIDPQGFVAEVFRESVMILKLIEAPGGGGELLVATGNEGQIFRVDPVSEETIILADLDPEQVPGMVVDRDGQVLLGTANPASLVTMAAGYAPKGVYTSQVLDANQVSHWGKLHITGTTPPGTKVTVEARSGNVQDPELAAWSDWSTPQELAGEGGQGPMSPRESDVNCPPARFLQYRLTLNGAGAVTPVVDLIQIKYVVPNLKPVISSITATYPGDEGGRSVGLKTGRDGDEHTPELEVKWDATDPNNDRLIYTLEYQYPGTDRWLLLADDLEDKEYKWDTRRVPDGRYIVRVTATDSPDNASDMVRSVVRRSDPILIDNTSPEFGELGHRLVEEGVVMVASEVSDALSPVRSIGYSVDSGDEWNPVVPDDLIYDSTRETFTIKLDGLKPGPHVVTVRVIDDAGNARYEAVTFEIQ